MTAPTLSTERLEEIRDSIGNTVGRILKPTDPERSEVAAIVSELLSLRALLDMAEGALLSNANASDDFRRCANGIIGASTGDPDAEEAFDMFMVAKDKLRFATQDARTALQAINTAKGTADV